MAEKLDWSGFTVEETGAPANADIPEKTQSSLDWTGFEDATPRRKAILSPEEVLEIAENEPERFRAAMERVRARENKGVVERINEYQGPLLRGMARGGQQVGNFVVNSVMRGVSYIPGMEHLADKADNANRLAAIQAAYDSYQDENSLTSEFIGATGAKLTGSLGETVSTGLLSGGVGRATGAANSVKGMTAFMAASYGAMDMDRHLTIGKDAGLTGVQKNIYATGMGGVSAGLTYAFGRVGEKLGGHTMEELLARGAGRSLTSLMTREGMKRELMDAAMEGTEEGTVAFAQAAYASMFGVEDDVDYLDRFRQGFVGGVVARAGMGVARRVPDKFVQLLEKVPDTYKGWKLAQDQTEGKVSAEEVKLQTEEKPDVKAAYEAEIAAIGKQQRELESKMDPFVARRTELEKAKNDLATRKAQLAAEETSVPKTPATVVPEVSALIERRRAEVAEIEAEYNDVAAKATNKKTALDLREEYAATAADLKTELDTAKSKLTGWETEAATPTGKSQYVDFYDRFPEDRYGEKMTIATMRDMFPEMKRADFDAMILKMAKEGRLSLMAATTENMDERISSGGIPSSAGRMRHIMFVKDPTKIAAPVETGTVDPAVTADIEGRKAKLGEEEVGLTKQEELLMAEEQEASSDIQKRRDFLNAEMERYVARQEKVEQGEAYQDATAAKQEFIERDRVKFGLDELPPLEAKAMLEALQTARSKGVPQKALTICKEAIGTNDIWDDETTIGVTAGYDVVKQQWIENRDRLAKATTDAERETFMSLDKDMVNELNIMSEAIHRVGSGQGRALASRKFIIPVDGDPDIVIKRARKSKGEALTNEETRNIMEASAIVKRLIGERDALTAGTKEFDDKNFELYEARLRLENFENTPGVVTLKDKASMVNYLWRDLVTGIDMAAAGIQGSLSLLSRPHIAIPSMWNGFKSHLDARGAVRADYDLFNRKNGDLYRDGVITINPEGPLLRNEDLAMQTMYGPWSKIPGVQPFLNFWPRIYRGMVNQLRADMFDAMLDSAGGRGNLTRPAIEDLGNLTDVMTGRGGRGYLDKHVSTLNLLMFAPRFSFSQAEFLIGKPIWGASKESRKYVMKEYGRIFTSWLSIYTAAALGNMFSNAAGEGDIMETVWNPTDSNFMKIKVGETWIDPTFRLGRWVAAAGQTTAAIYNNVSGTQGVPVVGLGGKPVRVGNPPPGLDSRRAGSFVRGKLSLPLGSLVDLTTGTYMTGEKVSEAGILGFAKNRVAPIAPKEIVEAMVERGVSQQLAVALLGFIGAPLKPVIAPKAEVARRQF